MDNDTKFNDLIFQALDHAIDSVSGGETLVPFVLTPSGINRFVADTLEKGKEEAEKFLKNNTDEPIISLAYDGYLTVEGEKADAIFVKGLNRTKGEEVILAQRYQQIASENGFKTVGNPVLVSKENLS